MKESAALELIVSKDYYIRYTHLISLGYYNRDANDHQLFHLFYPLYITIVARGLIRIEQK